MRPEPHLHAITESMHMERAARRAIIEWLRSPAATMTARNAISREVGVAVNAKSVCVALSDAIEHSDDAADHELAQAKAAKPSPQPIAMFLTCPKCNARHIDDGDFATKPHHTHACQHCGLTWRPAIEPTIGVAFLPGFKNDTAPAQHTTTMPTPRIERHGRIEAQPIGEISATIKLALGSLQVDEPATASAAFDALYELERRYVALRRRLQEPKREPQTEQPSSEPQPGKAWFVAGHRFIEQSRSKVHIEGFGRLFVCDYCKRAIKHTKGVLSRSSDAPIMHPIDPCKGPHDIDYDKLHKPSQPPEPSREQLIEPVIDAARALVKAIGDMPYPPRPNVHAPWYRLCLLLNDLPAHFVAYDLRVDPEHTAKDVAVIARVYIHVNDLHDLTPILDGASSPARITLRAVEAVPQTSAPTTNDDALYYCASCEKKPDTATLCTRCIDARHEAGDAWRGSRGVIGSRA
jgi:hypothetical protein